MEDIAEILKRAYAENKAKMDREMVAILDLPMTEANKVSALRRMINLQNEIDNPENFTPEQSLKIKEGLRAGMLEIERRLGLGESELAEISHKHAA